jgi:hypothetical protein
MKVRDKYFKGNSRGQAAIRVALVLFLLLIAGLAVLVVTAGLTVA